MEGTAPPYLGRDGSDDEADITLTQAFPHFRYGERLRITDLYTEGEEEVLAALRPRFYPGSKVDSVTLAVSVAKSQDADFEASGVLPRRMPKKPKYQRQLAAQPVNRHLGQAARATRPVQSKQRGFVGTPLASLVDWERDILWDDDDEVVKETRDGVSASTVTHSKLAQSIEAQRAVFFKQAEHERRETELRDAARAEAARRQAELEAARALDKQQKQEAKRKKAATEPATKATTPATPDKADKADKADADDKSEQAASPKQRKKRVVNKDKRPTDAIFTVDVFEKPRTELPVKQRTMLNELRPVNTEVFYSQWEKDVLWDESDEEGHPSHNPQEDDADNDSDEDDSDDNDDNEGAKPPKLAHASLYFDLNDPLLVTEAAVKRPTVTRRVVLQQNRGRHRIPDWKLRTMALVLASKGPFACKDESGRHRFNISNDVFYQSRRGAQTNKNSWRSLLDTSHRVTEAAPARKLASDLFPLQFGRIALFHRPKLMAQRGRFILESAHSLRQQHLKVQSIRQERLSQTSGAPFKYSGDFSALADEIFMAEYVEEHPTLVLQTSMCSNVRNYYRKIKPSDTVQPKLNYGTTVVLSPREASPFLGQVKRGQTFMSFENNIFRAPVFLHKTEKTDFLVVRRGGKYFIRQVPDLFIVGQTMPKVEVPVPKSKAAHEFLSDRLHWITLKLLKSQQGLVKLEDVQRYCPDESEGAIRKHLKSVANFNRVKQDDERGAWQVKDEVALTNDELEKLLSPERYCSYLSMLASEYRLEAMWDYSRVYNPLDEDEVDELVSNEERLMPWHLTKNFVDCVRKECLLAVTGAGDPTGNELGFSYIRVANKPAHMRGDDAMVPNLRKEQVGKMSDKDRDLRKIPLAKAREMLQKEYNYSEEYLKGISRWEVISLVRNSATQEASEKDEERNYARDSRTTAAEHQTRFEADCFHIWDQQALDLTNTEVRSSDEGSDDSEADEDDTEMASQLEQKLKGTAATKTTEQEEQDFSKFLKKTKKNVDDATSVVTSVTNASVKVLPTQLSITRRFQNEYGEFVQETEHVTDARVIALYLHRRQAPAKKKRRRHRLLKQVSETKLSISQKGAYRHRRDGNKGKRRQGRPSRDMDDDYSEFIAPRETVRVQRTGRNPEVALNTTLEDITALVVGLDHRGNFSVPVSVKNFPDYLATIKGEPIDLGTMRDKTRKHMYRSHYEYLDDLKRMVDNCRRYNGELSPYTSHAKYLCNSGERLVSKQSARLEELSAKLVEMR